MSFQKPSHSLESKKQIHPNTLDAAEKHRAVQVGVESCRPLMLFQPPGLNEVLQSKFQGLHGDHVGRHEGRSYLLQSICITKLSAIGQDG